MSFDYFSTEKNKEMSGMLLTGGGSMLERIVPVLALQWGQLPLDTVPRDAAAS